MTTTGTGYALFCDDVREEVGGTSTYVGVRVRPIESDRFPIYLGQICAVVYYRRPAGLPFDSFEVRISFPNDAEPFVAKLDRKDVSQDGDEDGSRDRVIESSYRMRGVPIAAPGRVVLEARCGDEPFAEYASLYFVHAAEPEGQE